MRQTCLLVLAFAVSLCGPLHSALAADPPPPPALTVGGLTALLGKAMPKRFAKYIDLNDKDAYARDIEVMVGDDRLALGDRTTDVNVQLFIRDGVVGAVKIAQQPWDRKGNAETLYATLVAELKDTELAPPNEDVIGPTGAQWNYDGGRLLASVDGDGGLGFYFLNSDMEESYLDFWANWNAMIEAEEEFYMF
jgi:hypothetical protein